MKEEKTRLESRQFVEKEKSKIKWIVYVWFLKSSHYQNNK